MNKMQWIRIGVVLCPVFGLFSCNSDSGGGSGQAPKAPAGPTTVQDNFTVADPVATLQFRADSALAKMSGTTAKLKGSFADGLTLDTDVAFPSLANNDFSANPIKVSVKTTCDASVGTFQKIYVNQNHLSLLNLVGPRHAFSIAESHANQLCAITLIWKNQYGSTYEVDLPTVRVAPLDDVTDLGVKLLPARDDKTLADPSSPIIASRWGNESQALALMSQTGLDMAVNADSEASLECAQFETVFPIKAQNTASLDQLVHAPTTAGTDDRFSASFGQNCRIFLTDSAGFAHAQYSRKFSVIFNMPDVEISTQVGANPIPDMAQRGLGQKTSYTMGTVTVGNPNPFDVYVDFSAPKFFIAGTSPHTSPHQWPFDLAVSTPGQTGVSVPWGPQPVYRIPAGSNMSIIFQVTPQTFCTPLDPSQYAPQVQSTWFTSVTVTTRGAPFVLNVFGSPTATPTATRQYQRLDQGVSFDNNWSTAPVANLVCPMG